MHSRRILCAKSAYIRTRSFLFKIEKYTPHFCEFARGGCKCGEPCGHHTRLLSPTYYTDLGCAVIRLTDFQHVHPVTRRTFIFISFLIWPKMTAPYRSSRIRTKLKVVCEEIFLNSSGVCAPSPLPPQGYRQAAEKCPGKRIRYI